MIVRMKLVPRGNESSDNPPTLNLPGCRKPLAVVCVRDRCWTPSCRWTVCTRCSNLLRANLSFFFFFPFSSFRFSNRNSPSILTFQFCFFFFLTDTFDLSYVHKEDIHWWTIIFRVLYIIYSSFFFLFFFLSLSNTFLQIQTNFIRHGPIQLVGRNLLHDFKNRFLPPSKKKREEN